MLNIRLSCLFRHIFVPLLGLLMQVCPAKRHKNLTKNPTKIKYLSLEDRFIMDRFQQLLNELSPLIELPLYAEKERAVRMKFADTLHLQLEEDEPKERLLLASFIHEIPAGKYRENLLKEGLKANAVYPRIGTLAYTERNNQLTLFEYIPTANLTGDKLADILAYFLEKARRWHQAIARGVLPQIVESEIKIDRAIFRK